jgi:LysM repeat protein
MQSYRIQSGDTLWALSRKFGTTVDALARANGIANPNLIYAGATLHIPGRNDSFQPAPPSKNPPANSGGTSSVSGIENRPGVAGNAMQTIKFFMSKGLTRAQAAGIAGNLVHESSFRPNAVGDGGTSFGIAQWHNGRGAAMKSWTQDHGYSPTSFKGQLEYLWHELNTSESNALSHLRNSGSAYDAGMTFCRYFERPAVISPARGQSAQNYYTQSLA